MKFAMLKRVAKEHAQLVPFAPQNPPTHPRGAFTRLDLVMVLAALVLLGMAILPGWANLKPRSERVVCLNNLQLIGRAFHIWSADHGNWRPFRVRESEGGTMPTDLFGNKIGNVWFEMAWISNELATPKILVCPSDTDTTRVAVDFSNRPDGGFVHFNYRNNAVSYFLGLDSYPERLRSVLAGDRNLRLDVVNRSCSSRIINVASVLSPPSSQAAWLNTIHRRTGNVLFNDGRVQEITSAEVSPMIGGGDDGGSAHLLMPK